MLNGQNISKTVCGKKILNDVSFEVEEGAVVTLLGPSGSGKTSVLRLVMGLDSHEAGTLQIDDTLLSDHRRIHVRPENRGFSLFFQEFSLFPHLNVQKNVELGISHLPKPERGQIMDELLDLLNVRHLRSRPIDKLSGGEQQRVALARTLAVRPRVLLLDEPFSNVDQMKKQELYERLKAYLNEHGITTVIATHDHAEAFFFSDRIYVLRDGEVVDHNTPTGLYSQPATPWIASFLGETNYLTGVELATNLGFTGDGIRDDRYYLVRPEEFDCSLPSGGKGNAVVERVWFYGFYREILAKLENGRTVRMKDLHRAPVRAGDHIRVQVSKTVEALRLTEQAELESDA